MNTETNLLTSTLSLIIAFLTICLVWTYVERQNMEVKNKINLTHMQVRLGSLEDRADDLLYRIQDKKLNIPKISKIASQ